MFAFLGFIACLILTSLPQIAALRQIIHDEGFQPDYVLRVTQQEVSIACRTKFTALINGRRYLSLFFPSKQL